MITGAGAWPRGYPTACCLPCITCLSAFKPSLRFEGIGKFALPRSGWGPGTRRRT